MEVYKTEDGRSYVVIGSDKTKAEAVKEANKHFKVRKEDLKVCAGYIQDDTLYFEASKGRSKVWAVYRERKVS